MKPGEAVETKDSLQATRDAFEQWRCTRRKRDRIPEHLWGAAINLGTSYSTFRIAKELRLDYKELKRRMLDRSAENTPSEFVELKVEPLFSSNACLIEMRSPSGFEMKLEIPAALDCHLPGLVSQFLREGR